jgi:putative protease
MESLPSAIAPELLAPAGDWDCVGAAIENGADAIYFGLDIGFNARARAANFPLADLPRLMETLHLRGVKGYTTVNTLVFSDELEQLQRVIRDIAVAGVDAVLVQDVGAARLIRVVCPDLPLHASTQMTLTSAETIALAEALGIERVVLARELSLDDIRAIRHATNMPLEVFVHGALCVAYSGQCLTSESLGGRSANRGQCAQACRLPYELICDGRDVDLAAQKYLLSPQDLAAYALVPDLIAAGVCSLKIEGRLKTPEYVANITRHYRQAIDHAMAGKPAAFSPRAVQEMELSFSRGFSHGWLAGNDHKALVPAISSAKRGVYLGQIVGVRGDRVTVDLAAELKRGDGISFASGGTADDDEGGRVYEIWQAGKRVVGSVESGRADLEFRHHQIDFRKLSAGQAVWKTDDPELTSRLRKSFTSEAGRRRQPLAIEAHVATGEPLTITARLGSGISVTAMSEQPAVEAATHPLTLETLEKQLGRLGGTPFELATLRAEIVGRPMLPFSVLGKLRHQLVEKLEAACREAPPRRIETSDVLHTLRPAPATSTPQQEPTLHVLCRSLPQLERVLAAGERRLYADFADIRQYREAVARVSETGGALTVATPRIQKPGEIGIFHALAKSGGQSFLVRNFAGLKYFTSRGTSVVCDFSLNVTNELTADYFLSQGAARVTASYDLNREQLLTLIEQMAADRLEVVVHQHMPMFHMEHCVFCSVLSPGTNKTNCGRPCDHHEVELRDRIGMAHPLTADVGCRNTLFNATAQSGAEIVPSLLVAGVRHFRIELLNETEKEIVQTIRLYRSLLAGDISGKEVWTQLKASNRLGVTRGTLEERRNPLAIL